MTNGINFGIFFNVEGANVVNSTIKGMTTNLNVVENSVSAINKSFNKTFGNIQKDVKSISFSSILDQIDRASNGLNNLSQPGVKVSSAMADLSAITGVTGKGLQEIEGYARSTSKTFGVDAAQGIESYKLILSQLSPEIAKNPKALKAMGESVGVLSKTMGGDTVAATSVMTTAMNQFQVSLDDPIKASKEMAKMMNIMSAGAKEGSAEMPQIQQALEQSGLAAKTANVSFAETNAAIQILDKNGKKGAEGGVALRNVMATLSEGRFLPKDTKAELAAAGIDVNRLGDKSLTLAQRLKPLEKIMGDNALVTKLFGKENSSAAIAMISNIDPLNQLTQKIQGTNTAYEQAAIVMESPAEKAKRLQANIDDLKISMFSATGGVFGYLEPLSKLTFDLTNLAPIYNMASSAISTMTSRTKLQALWTNISSGATKIATIATRAWTMAKIAGTRALSLLTNGIKISAIWGGIIAVKTGIATAAQWAWNVALNANPIGLVVLAIAALVGIVILCWNKFEGFRKVVYTGWEMMKTFGSVIKDYVINRFKELLSGITGIGSALMAFFAGDWEKAWSLGKKATSDLLGAGSAKTAINTLKNQIPKDIEIGIKKGHDSWVSDNPVGKKKKLGKKKGVNIVVPPVEDIKIPPMPGSTAKLPKVPKGGDLASGTKNNTGGSETGTSSKIGSITIHKLVENLTIQTTNLSESKEKIKAMIEDVLLTAVTDVDLAHE